MCQFIDTLRLARALYAVFRQRDFCTAMYCARMGYPAFRHQSEEEAMPTRDEIMRALARCGCVLLVVFAAERAYGAESPSALALLRGVELARTNYDSLRATFSMESTEPGHSRRIECLVELDGGRRRFEILSAEGTDRGVVLIDGDEVHSFIRAPHADVTLYDMKYLVGVSGVPAFDPRALGLSDLMAADTTVKACLWYENCDSVELVGKEELNGISVWRVKATAGGAETHFWIEEPSFRVHRRTIESPTSRTEINSKFSSSEPMFPFPSRVETKRVRRRGTMERTFIVDSFDFGRAIPPERFTLKSMDLPVNTALVDYRIQRIVGYWDGEGLSEDPVSQRERPLERTAIDSQGGRRLILIAINLLVVLALAVIIWVWRSRAAASA